MSHGFAPRLASSRSAASWRPTARTAGSAACCARLERGSGLYGRPRAWAAPATHGHEGSHRLARGGNRELNRALYTIAITEIRADTEGRAYYERKRAEGKTGREALRCLKRRLSDVVYRTLRTDQAATSPVPLAAAA